MHVAHHESSLLCSQILPYLQQCSSFFAEVDLNTLKEEDIRHLLMLENDQNISQIAGAKEWEKAVHLAEERFNFDLEPMRNTYPFLILHHLQMGFLSQGSFEAMDQALWAQAKELGKECGGLESMSEHFEVLKAISLEKQWRDLYLFLKNPISSKRKLNSLFNAYMRQDIRSLYKSSKKGLGSSKNVMIYNRNKLMTEFLSSKMQLNRVSFAAVGAAHLYGKSGMLALLKRQGYQLKPVKLEQIISR